MAQGKNSPVGWRSECPISSGLDILGDRLKLLTTLGVIERVDEDRAARNIAFQLTKSGKKLRKVLEALGGWSHANLKELHPTMVGMD